MPDAVEVDPILYGTNSKSGLRTRPTIPIRTLHYTALAPHNTIQYSSKYNTNDTIYIIINNSGMTSLNFKMQFRCYMHCR